MIFTPRHGSPPLAAALALGIASWTGPAAADVSDTSVNIYGHAMLDMGYQTKQNDPDWFDVLRPTKLPSVQDEFGDDGSWFTSVRQSRLGVKTSTPTSAGELKTIFEFEMFGVGADAGQTTIRLRHAWGELGKFGAGQTWSTFMDIDVFPNSQEYWGPSGMVFFRNMQARWTPWSDGDSRIAISLEQPGASGDRGEYDDDFFTGVSGDFELPDLAGHFRWARDWGHVQVAGILRQIKWSDNDTTDGIDLSGDTIGWGVNVSSNYKIGRHVLRGSVVYGEAIENYMNDATVDIAAVATGDPAKPFDGEAIPLLGVVLFLDLNWSDKWTSTIGYSMLDLDLPTGQSPDAFQKGQYALTNLQYHPVPNVMYGVELQWGDRANFSDGFSSDDVRVQFSAKYNFDRSFGGNQK